MYGAKPLVGEQLLKSSVIKGPDVQVGVKACATAWTLDQAGCQILLVRDRDNHKISRDTTDLLQRALERFMR
jgi:hypothetical protein